MHMLLHCNVIDYHTVSQKSSHLCMAFNLQMMYKSKVVPYLIMSTGHRADPGFLAVSPQVKLVINFVVGIYT